jgi:pimeloyl-ACP methyl ester carboxylesterase
MSTFLKDVLTELDEGALAICSSSLGGLFTSRFSVDYPDRVSRLVVLGIPGGYKWGFLCR